MFELITVIVESIRDALPRLVKHRKEKRLNTVGAELYLVYIRLNEIITGGDHLLEVLEAFATFDGPVDSGKLKHLDRVVEDQARALTSLAASVEPLARYIYVVDPTSYARLASLIAGKASALNALPLWGHRVPLGVDAGDVRLLGDRLQPGDFYNQVTTVSPSFDTSGEVLERLRKANAAPTDVGDWGETEKAAVREYLERAQPRAQLNQIRACAEAMRTALLEHFDATELLMAVGDPNFHPEFNAFRPWVTPLVDSSGAYVDNPDPTRG